MTPRPQVVTIGETMAVFASEPGQRLQHSPEVSVGIAGSESNVAIGLQRLGVDATWVGRVGEDSLGELVRRELHAERVTVVARSDSHRSTALMIKESRAANDTRVSYYRSGHAGSALAPDDIDDGLIQSADLLHVTGISLALSASMAEAIMHAVGIARQSGVAVSFDLNYRSRLWSSGDARRAYEQLIPSADIVFASDTEAEMLIGRAGGASELALAIAALGPDEVIITRGPAGALARVGGEEFVQPAVDVEVVDTVGAGDAFVAGYLADRLEGRSVGTSLRTGAETGALACTSASDWHAAPTRRELERGRQAADPVSR